MGAIMSIGVATANSILLVNFANDLRETGADAMTAALEAGFTRLRPVMMTALAMIVGMLPMALGLGEGGEQNAPLGRAVIGGLLLATVATLFFVPVVYSVLAAHPAALRQECRSRLIMTALAAGQRPGRAAGRSLVFFAVLAAGDRRRHCRRRPAAPLPPERPARGVRRKPATASPWSSLPPRALAPRPRTPSICPATCRP